MNILNPTLLKNILYFNAMFSDFRHGLCNIFIKRSHEKETYYNKWKFWFYRISVSIQQITFTVDKPAPTGTNAKMSNESDTDDSGMLIKTFVNSVFNEHFE